LLKQYDFNTLLDMLQEQADGKPVRPGYLRVDLKENLKGNGGQPAAAKQFQSE
jgi:hypothetical protein